MKVSELKGTALDWAVAKCEGELSEDGGQVHLVGSKVRFYEDTLDIQYAPSTDWAQGGPIVEREKIGLKCHSDGTWEASHPECLYWKRGETPLIAAMRCYVASKLGDEIELPEELIAEAS